MKKFQFSQKDEPTKFIGSSFYRVYKDAEFLRCSENVETILSKGHELRQNLKKVAPGQHIVIDKMLLERNTPLLVKNTSGPNVTVHDYEFTYNRLAGLTAAYAFDNRHRFPVIKSTEAELLGLEWDNGNTITCQLYLSAVSGTEHFEQFSFFPLICALRKLQLKKITLEPVIKIAKIKNNDGESMASVLKKNYEVTVSLWKFFPGANTSVDFKSMIQKAPPALKKLFDLK